MSRWHADLAAHDEAFACLQDLFTPQSFAMTAVKAIREWGQGLLRLSAALVKENDALERENARLRERIAELERRRRARQLHQFQAAGQRRAEEEER